MKRGSLFFIGLISAIATFTGLNYALGRPGYYYERYHSYNHRHCFDERYDRRYDERYDHDYQHHSDSLHSNY